MSAVTISDRLSNPLRGATRMSAGSDVLSSESLDIERVHFRRAILDLEQVAPLVDGGGAPPNVYNRWRVRLES